MRLDQYTASLIAPALAVALFAGPARAADARVAFVAAGGLSGGAYHAAIVIDLAPDTTTYWRNPGDAGSPPSFDFSRSDNLAAAAVEMPAPKRIEEAGLDVFGYHDRVAFPVTIRPADPTRPVLATLKMDYAACRKICMPMHAEATVEFAPGAAPGPNAPIVAAAEAAIPKKLAAEAAATLTPVADAKKPTWTVTPKAAGALDLFAEVPAGYFAETKRMADGAFRLSLVEAPPDKPVPDAPARLTLATKQGAVEFSVRLDAARRAP